MTDGKAGAREALGSFVRKRRRELGLTQVQLGERLGWPQERISVLENGKYGLPSLPILAELTAALDVPLAAVLEAVGYGGSRSDETEVANMATSESMSTALLHTMQNLLAIEAMDLNDSLSRASDLLAEAMGADKIDAFMFQPETATLVALGTSATPMGHLQHQVGLHRMPLANRGRTAEAFESGQSYYTGHADEDPGIAMGITQVLGVRSLLLVPLVVEGRIRGVLGAASRERDRFSVPEQNLFHAAARWVGMLVHRAELVEQVRRQAAEDARRLAADELISILAHDLGNSLTPLRSRLEMAERRVAEADDPRVLRDLSEAHRAAKRLDAMVRDLLDVARLDIGALALRPEPVQVTQLVEDVIETIRPLRQTIQVRVLSDVTAMGDEERLRQALHNVTFNAVQHTSDDVAVVVSVNVVTHDDGRWAVITVADSGPGIPSHVLGTLFTRHARGDLSSGLGLGLYLARSVLELHGGTLTAESSPGNGATFTLTWPVEQPTVG